MREIITPGGRRTRLRKIPEFSKNLWEACAEIGRLDTSASNFQTQTDIYITVYRQYSMNIMMLYTYVYYIYILLLLYMQKFYWPQSLELWLISKIGLLKIDNDASQQLLKSFWLLNEYWRATSTHLQFKHVWVIYIAL